VLGRVRDGLRLVTEADVVVEMARKLLLAKQIPGDVRVLVERRAKRLPTLRCAP